MCVTIRKEKFEAANIRITQFHVYLKNMFKNGQLQIVGESHWFVYLYEQVHK